MLDQRMVRDLAPDAVGTVRYNHEGCPAGTDTRRRLYVTRKGDPPTLVVAYCHNCGESGVASERDKIIFANTQFAKQELMTGEKHEAPEDLPETSEPLVDHVGKSWPMRYGITDEEMNGFNLRWDVEEGKIVLPIYRYIDRNRGREGEEDILSSHLIGYQLRRYFQADNRPKYMTSKFSGTNILETLVANNTLGVVPCVVIVEDLLSAIKVSRSARVTVPLYGTHIRSERLLELSKIYPVIVWLDNDGPQVLKHRDRIKSLVDCFGRKCSVVDTLQDPKGYATPNISEVLDVHARLTIT